MKKVIVGKSKGIKPSSNRLYTLLYGEANSKIMTRKNKIGFWLMIISLVSMLIILLGFGNKVGYAVCHIPLLIGLMLYK